MNEKEVFQEREDYLKRLIKSLEKRMKKLPKGSLRVTNCHGHIQYYYRENETVRSGVYIRKEDRGLANKLAQKDYYAKLIKAAKMEMDAIRKYLERVPDKKVEDIYYELSEARKNLVLPIYETDKDFVRQWNEVEYIGKGFNEYDAKLYTNKGERVRSKSEVIIANQLAKYNVPYRYEYPMEIDGLGVVYPDFTVLNVRERKEVIWEHFGMMDEADYAEKNIHKLLLYNQNGFAVGDKLLLTMETKATPIDVRQVNRMIEQYLV